MAERNSEIYKVTLKSWLWEQIYSGKYRGLEWKDEKNRIFKLPWVKETDPHSTDYYRLFHDWAEREGGQSHDPQKAKRNFRSALNHSKHFFHLKEYDEERQTGSFKVYKFLSPGEISSQKVAKQRNFSQESNASSRTTISPGLGLLNGYEADLSSTPPYFANGYHGLNDLNAEQVCMHTAGPMNVMGHDFSVNNPTTTDASICAGMSDVDMASIPSVGSDQCISITRDMLKRAKISLDDQASCIVTIEYSGMLMDSRNVSLKAPCEIIYGDKNHVSQLENLNCIRGSLIPGHVILLPEPTPSLEKIVRNMNTGIIFWFQPDTLCIYGLRHCLAQAFLFSMEERNAKPIKMERNTQYLLFSYEQFLNALGQGDFIPSESSTWPLSKVEIVVGVEPKPDQREKAVKGVKITLQPLGAWKLRNCEDKDLAREICLSMEESSLDKQLHRMKLSHSQF